MSLSFLKPCHMSVSSMLHVEFKKRPCRPFGFKGQGPYRGLTESVMARQLAAKYNGSCGAGQIPLSDVCLSVREE